VTQENSAARLLDREPHDDTLREQTAQAASGRRAIDRGTKSIVIFRIGGEWLALPTDVFQEVAEKCTVHTLPHRRGGILGGLVNVRGELLLCVALEVLLGLEKAPAAQERAQGAIHPLLLVCNRKGDRLAFPVNEVFGVHRYSHTDLRDVPATLANAAAGAYTVGLAPWKGRTVGCLDSELVFYGLNKGLA
jgi:chemotaxis-related protein WspD